VFADEPLTATVSLDVYAVPALPSTREHLSALRRLTDENWTSQLTFEITGDDAPPRIAVRTLASQARHMGPGSPEPAAKTVPFTAYEGRFALPRLAPGTYTLHVRADGLEAAAPFIVASGREPAYRDAYLEAQAEHARSYAQFRELQLERVRLDPTKAGALLALGARALEDGTLEETSDYYNRAVTAMQQNVAAYAQVAPQWREEQEHQLTVDIRHIHALQQMLPTYFAQRSSLRVTTDPRTGAYQLVERSSGRVVREER
jgi:hypothetical protein